MVRNKPFFSIIIPTLNEAKYLPNLLQDLANQTFKEFEIIVVDGRSDDQTVAKAQVYAKKLPLTILTSHRRHVCTQRNLGARHALTDWLIFMDADNRLPPYFLQGIKYRLEVEPADLATCYLTSDSSKQLDKSYALAINYAVELLKNTPQSRVMEALVILSKQAFLTIGGFDEKVDFAEGNNLVSATLRHGFVFRIYKDPSYIYSFRRFRTFGLFNTFKKGAQLELINLLKLPIAKSATKKLYPMEGGKLFEQKRISAFSKKVTKLLDVIRQ